MLTGCLETDGSEGEPLSNGCVWLRSKRERREIRMMRKGEGWEENGGAEARKKVGKMCHQHPCIVYLKAKTEQRERATDRESCLGCQVPISSSAADRRLVA